MIEIPVYLTKTDGNSWLIVSSADDRNLCYCDTKEKGEFIINVVNSYGMLLEATKRLVELASYGMAISPNAFAIKDLRKIIGKMES